MTPRLSPVSLPVGEAEALAGIEINHIARGFVAADALVKKAAARVVLASPVTPGKFLILLDGLVADVEESLLEAERIAAEQTIDRFLLPFAHRALEPALFGILPSRPDGAIGIVETSTACSGIRSMDAALKAAPVVPVVIHLSIGIGGKCYFALAGDLYDMQAAVAAAGESLGSSGRLLATEIIASPHPEFVQAIGI